jgi:hypothetical protein
MSGMVRLAMHEIDVGEEPFARVMGRAVVGTLDRQDRYYRELVGPQAWGARRY